MPTASDGKEFPYTADGIRAMQAYESSLKKEKRSMGRSNRVKKTRSFIEDIAGKRTGSMESGQSEDDYARDSIKAGQSISGFIDYMSRPMEDHIVGRTGVKSPKPSKGRNNPRY